MQCSCSANSSVFVFPPKRRAASSAPAVLLDASQSFDPDASAGPDTNTGTGAGIATSPLSYLWVCAPASECPTLPNGGSPVLSVPAALFVGAAADTVPLTPILLEILRVKSSSHCLESSLAPFPSAPV
jgi:hypothetical protein